MSSSAIRHSLPLSLLLAAVFFGTAAQPAVAQRVSTVTGPPTHQIVHVTPEPTVVGDKEMRRVAASLDAIDVAMRQIRSHSSAVDEHRQLIDGMADTLMQLRAVHLHLEGMFRDPAIAKDAKAARAFSRVYRELETMTRSLQGMTASTVRAIETTPQKSN